MLRLMMNGVINQQPEDASYAEILKGLGFKQMIDRGLDDSKKGRAITNQEMKQKIYLFKGVIKC